MRWSHHIFLFFSLHHSLHVYALPQLVRRSTNNGNTPGLHHNNVVKANIGSAGNVNTGNIHGQLVQNTNLHSVHFHAGSGANVGAPAETNIGLSSHGSHPALSVPHLHVPPGATANSITNNVGRVHNGNFGTNYGKLVQNVNYHDHHFHVDSSNSLAPPPRQDLAPLAHYPHPQYPHPLYPHPHPHSPSAPPPPPRRHTLPLPHVASAPAHTAAEQHVPRVPYEGNPLHITLPGFRGHERDGPSHRSHT